MTDKDRSIKRIAATCTIPQSPLTAESATTSRRLQDPCGDLIIPDPSKLDIDQFRTPVEPLQLPVPLSDLPYIEISSSGNADCSMWENASGSIIGTGTSVTIQGRVYLAVVSDITDLQRNHIATLSQAELNSWSGFTVAQIIESGQLTTAQVGVLQTEITAAQVSGTVTANAAALAALDCYYSSTTQTATCEADADGFPANSSTSTSAAGLFQSTLSQADANAQALAAASSLLVCTWSNTTQTAACAVGASGEAVPGSFTFTGANSPGVNAQIGTATVAGGLISSTASRADANEQALLLAASFINCFFVNTSVTAACAADTSGNAANAGTITATVAAGTLASLVGVADATAQALLLAQSQLVCRWKSISTTRTCDSTDNPRRDAGKDAGGTYQAASSSASLVYSVTVAANRFESDVSLADANSQATILALAQLDCAWCNKAVAPVCSLTNIPAVTGSLDETSGVAAGTFCASSYLLAKDIAESTASVPLRVKVVGSPTCRFQNAAVRASCYPLAALAGYASYSKYDSDEATANGALAAAAAAQYILVAAGAVVSIVSAANATEVASVIALSQLNCFWSSTSSTFSCAVDANGITVSSNATPAFTVPAGQFTSYTNQTEANNLRDTYGASLLSCFWESAAITITCGDTLAGLTTQLNASPNTPTTITGTAAGKFDGVAAVDSRSNGAVGKPVTVKLRTISSYTSQAEANTMAITLATSQLVCFYTNSESKTGAACAEGETRLRNGVVGVGQVTDWASLSAANIMAQTLADALTTCVLDDMIGGGGTVMLSSAFNGTCTSAEEATKDAILAALTAAGEVKKHGLLVVMASGAIYELRTPDPGGNVPYRVFLGGNDPSYAKAIYLPCNNGHAFQLSDATSAETAQVKIKFGMVNNVTPGGMGDPSETSLTLTVGSSGYVVLTVTTNTAGAVTSATISIAASIPYNTSTLGNIALGYVTKKTGPASVSCSQSVSGSLAHVKCGATTHLFGKV